MTQPRTPRKWHESAADVVVHAVFFGFLTAVITSPCWGLALLAWAVHR